MADLLGGDPACDLLSHYIFLVLGSSYLHITRGLLVADSFKNTNEHLFSLSLYKILFSKLANWGHLSSGNDVDFN